MAPSSPSSLLRFLCGAAMLLLLLWKAVLDAFNGCAEGTSFIDSACETTLTSRELHLHQLQEDATDTDVVSHATLLWECWS